MMSEPPGSVMYWIRSERESMTPNPVHAVHGDMYETTAAALGMEIRSIGVDDIVIGSTPSTAAVYVRGERVHPHECFFHTMLMSWPVDRFDIWRHLRTFAALESIGFFTTVPMMHSLLNNDKLLTGVGTFGAGLPRLPTVRVGTRGHAVDARNRYEAEMEAARLQFPLMVKPAYWGCGFGVFVAQDSNELEGLLNLAEAAELTLVLQPWLGRRVTDYRIYCLDGEPFMAAARRSTGDAVVGNAGQGGIVDITAIPEVLRAPARLVASRVGTSYLCVDFLMVDDEWWFSEIEIDGANALHDPESLRVRFTSYRDRFAAYVAAGAQERAWHFDGVGAST
jgi:hypothetical protein